MKKIFNSKLMVILIIMFGVLFIPNIGYAKDITVVHNNETLKFDVLPIIKDGRTMIPLRATLESLGLNVSWDNKIKKVTATNVDYNLNITLNDDKCYVSYLTGGLKGTNDVITMDVPLMIINNRTLVPVRFVAEAIGCTVLWNGEERKVIIIDHDFIFNNLKNNCPNLYELLINTLKGTIKTINNSGSYEFDLGIENADKVKGTVNVKLSTKVSSDKKDFEVHLSSTLDKNMQKMINDLLHFFSEELNISSTFTMDIYLVGNEIYIDSSIFKQKGINEAVSIDGDISGGILYTNLDKNESYKETITPFRNANVYPKDGYKAICDYIDEMIERQIFDEEDIEELLNKLKIVNILFRDEYFTKTTDGYKYSFDLLKSTDALNEIGKILDTDPEEFKKAISNFTITYESKVKNNELYFSDGSFNIKGMIANVICDIKAIIKESKDDSITVTMPKHDKAYICNVEDIDEETYMNDLLNGLD